MAKASFEKGNIMKTKFYSLFLLVILSLFMTATAWAAEAVLQGDENTGFYVNLNAGAADNLTIAEGNITGGVFTFKLT